MAKKKSNKKVSNNGTKEIQSSKMATPEQIETLENFVKTYSADLSKQLRRLDLITQISSNKGQYNPVLSEQYVNDANFNPSKASSHEISRWLMSPQYFDANIRHLSQYLENAVGQYGRAVWFLNTEKSFNYLLTPADADNKDMINSKEYMNSYNMALNTLRKMNIKYNFLKWFASNAGWSRFLFYTRN